MSRFQVSLLAYISDARLRAEIEKHGPFLFADEPVFDSPERFEFAPENLTKQSDLIAVLKQVIESKSQRCVIVISDKLASHKGLEGLKPSSLTKTIRELFFDSRHLCGLVALAPGATRRILDVDRFVDTNSFSPEALQLAIVKTANGLRLKAPPNRIDTLAEDEAFKIIAVQSRDQMFDSLGLRFSIYELMGYLPDDISSNSALIEMDPYDLNSIHLAAVHEGTGEVVGTTRLVVQQVTRHERTLVGNPRRTMSKQREWCEQIARNVGVAALTDRIHAPPFLPLPILQSSDFRGRWSEILEEARRGGEVSRVVVTPRYRGRGLSTLLVQAAIAVAHSINKRFLLLECIPGHAKMYAKCGFERMEGHHNRVQELDQVAVGMRLELEKTPDNVPVHLAIRHTRMLEKGNPDDGMLFGTKYLCLCRHRNCWRHGGYGYHGRVPCPIREHPI